MKKKLPNTQGTDTLGKLLLESVNGLPVELRDLVFVAAIPRFFTADLLCAVLPLAHNHIQRLISQLRALRFVTADSNDRYYFHDLLRQKLLTEWHSRRPDEYARLNELIAIFYDSAIRPIKMSREKAEAIYHLTLADENNGFTLFQKDFLLYLELGQLDFCSVLLEAISTLEDGLSPDNRAWLLFCRSLLLERLQDPKDAIENYKKLEIQEGWPSEIRAYLLGKIIGLTNHSRMHPTDQQAPTVDVASMDRTDASLLLLQQQIVLYRLLLRLIVSFVVTVVLIALIFRLPTLLSWEWLINHPKRLGLELCASLVILGCGWVVVDHDKNRRWIAFASIVVAAIIAIIQLI